MRVVISLFFLGISVTLRRINPQSENWKLFFAFFVASFAFLIGLFFLSIACGWLVQKTGTILGSVLFHAGSDLIIKAGIVKTFTGGQYQYSRFF